MNILQSSHLDIGTLPIFILRTRSQAQLGTPEIFLALFPHAADHLFWPYPFVKLLLGQIAQLQRRGFQG